jgi:formamidopyrimidine-DNA glycosylase
MTDEPTQSRMDRVRARAFRITDRLNRASVSYLGPAQHGNFQPEGTEVKPLTDTPCPICGQPMSRHDLVRSHDARQRFYCPAPESGPTADPG